MFRHRRRHRDRRASVVINHLAQHEQAAELIDRFCVAAIAVSTDLTKDSEVTALARQVYAAAGPVDILVNNAGAYPRVPWHEMTDTDWADALEANLTIHYRVTRAFTTATTNRRWGRISDADAIAAIELKPDEIARFLVNALRSDGGLAALPDLRQVDRAK